MTVKAIPRHARTPGRQRWVPAPPRAGRWHRGRAPGMARPGPLRGAMPADPLAGPVAITQRAVVGDRIRRPTAWCEMAACISRFEDPAALGEADIRARALAAGWRHDNLGRLLCPYCQWRRPGSRAASPVAGQDNPPALRQAGPARAGRISAILSTLPTWQRRLPGGRHLPPDWPRLLAALVCSHNGWTTPPLGPTVGAAGRRRRGGPAGTGHSPQNRHAAAAPARSGADDHRRPRGQRAGPGTEAARRRTGRHAAHRHFRAATPPAIHPGSGTAAAGTSPAIVIAAGAL
jgi:hypothetical protein